MTVSVIIPVFNSESTIAAAVESLASQTRIPDEVIVVDNGSTDETLSTLREAISRLPQLPIVVVSELKRGPAAARNRGLSFARGEIIAFMDSDCIAETAWAARLHDYFTDFHVQAVGGIIVIHNPRNSIEKHQAVREIWVRGKIPTLDALNADHLIIGNYMTTNNCAYRANLLREIGGFDESFLVGEDIDLYLRYIAVLKPVDKVLIHRMNVIMYHEPRRTFRQCARQKFSYSVALARLVSVHFRKRILLSWPGNRLLEFNEAGVTIWAQYQASALTGYIGLCLLLHTYIIWLLLGLAGYLLIGAGVSLKRAGLSASPVELFELAWWSFAMRVVSKTGKLVGSFRYGVVCW